MASSECINEKPSTCVELTEDDIPGASLNEPFHSHTMAELRCWLLCWGIVVPTSWKKHQVVQRYDVGVHLLRLIMGYHIRVQEVSASNAPVIDVDGLICIGSNSNIYQAPHARISQCYLFQLLH